MIRQLSPLIGSTFLAVTLSLTATAQECPDGAAVAPVYGPQYSNGGACAKGRKEAILTPVEAFGVHPPGLDPADANRCWILHRWREMWIPYYAPLSPTSTSARWKPWCYFPLMPYYTPYYMGYCPHRCHTPEPPPYGSDGWGQGPMPGHDPVHPPLNYGGYTSVLRDDTIFWNMGGNGLVPYGTPPAPRVWAPDLVDQIQVTRGQGGACSPNGAPVVPVSGGAPALLPPTENGDEKQGYRGNPESKETPPAEKSAPPE